MENKTQISLISDVERWLVCPNVLQDTARPLMCVIRWGQIYICSQPNDKQSERLSVLSDLSMSAIGIMLRQDSKLIDGPDITPRLHDWHPLSANLHAVHPLKSGDRDFEQEQNNVALNLKFKIACNVLNILRVAYCVPEKVT